MNINTMEQRLIISELMKRKKATKNELAEALIVSGLDSLESLPAKNAVRAGIIALQRKLQGRGIRFGKGSTRGGDFDFASSNPLWRGAVDVLDFVPLTNASYSGGIIITEWFSSENNTDSTNRELKITVRFMSNEIRADAIKILVFEKSCIQNNCKTKKIKSKLEGELKLAILKKAALFEKDDFKKFKETKGKNRAKNLGNLNK